MSTRPLILVTEHDHAAGLLRVRVEVDKPVAARFALTVAAGGNRTTHRGVTGEGAPVGSVLSSVMVAAPAGEAWSVELQVEPAVGSHYEEARHSS